MHRFFQVAEIVEDKRGNIEKQNRKCGGERETSGTFFFEESATVFAGELRNVILGELMEGLVEDRPERGCAPYAVHRLLTLLLPTM